MVGTVASLRVLINTVGLVSWTGLPGLTMRRIFGCPDGSHRTDAFNRGNCPGLRAMLHRTGATDIYCGIIFLLATASYCLSRFAWMSWRVKDISIAG